MQVLTNRKQHRAAMSEARNQKPTSRTAKRMARPERQDALTAGSIKLNHVLSRAFSVQAL